MSGSYANLARMAMIPAVFLDRDGTINEDPGYVSRLDQVALIPGAAEGVGVLKKAGFFLIVVSNQSGVGRGYIDPAMLPQIHDKMNGLLSKAGGQIDHFEFCVHHPDVGCDCRKPKPKMLLEAAARFGVDLAHSYMVGDKEVDIQAGRAAGCGGVALVRTGYGKDTESRLVRGDCDFVGDTLKQVADWIVSRENAKP